MKKFSCVALLFGMVTLFSAVGCGGHKGGVIKPEEGQSTNNDQFGGFESQAAMDEYEKSMQEEMEKANEMADQ